MSNTMRLKSTKLKIILPLGIFLLASCAFFLLLPSSYHNRIKSSNAPTPVTSLENENSEKTTEIIPPEVSTDSPSVATDSPEEKPDNLEPEPVTTKSSYPLHTNITATVFWVGEPKGGGSSEDNALSAWDDSWQKHFGCFDDPESRDGYHPKGCTPKENPFYFDLPYDDFDWEGNAGRRSNANQVVPWAKTRKWSDDESMLKNRWLKISREGVTCYGQWEDAGPYVYDDAKYVFGHNDARPKSKQANNAGMDVSPALRDCLKFIGKNNDSNKVSWQFIEAADVPAGPWKNIVTTRGTFWK